MPVVVRGQIGTHRAMMVAIVVVVMTGTIIGTSAAKSSTGIAGAMVVMIATGAVMVGSVMIVAGTVAVMTRAVMVGAIIIVAGAVAVMTRAVMVGTVVIIAGTVAVMPGAVMSVITGTRLRLMGARGRFAAVNAATAIGYRHRKSNTKRKYSGGFKESVHKLNFYN